MSFGQGSGGVGSVDPYRVHREFPDRWAAWCRAQFGSDYRDLMVAFDVSERTARKWLAGDCGANGGHVAVAVLTYPETAPEFLFAAE